MLFLIFCTIINFYTNEVEIKRSDSTIIPFQGITVLDKDTILVKDSSKAELLYDDSSKLFIDENSRIVIKEEKGAFISAGRVWAKIREILTGKKYSIESPVSVCGVRGTEFTVSFLKEGESTVKVISGEVNVRERETGSEVILSREKMALIRRGMKLKIKKFKLKELKRWNEWKERHLDFLLKKASREINRGNLMKAKYLLEQGRILIRRLKLSQEEKMELERLEEKLEKMKEERGSLRYEIENIQHSTRKTRSMIANNEPIAREIKDRVEFLERLKKQIEFLIKNDKKLQAKAIMPEAISLINRIDRMVSSIPLWEIKRRTVELNNFYRKINTLKQQIGEPDMKTRIDKTERLVKKTKKDADIMNKEIKRTISNFVRLKKEIDKMKIELK